MQNRIFKIVSFLIILFLTYKTSDAQQYPDIIRTQKTSRWSIGIMASPDWQGRFFSAEKDSSKVGTAPQTHTGVNEDLQKLLRDNESSTFSYTTGFHIMYDINKRWFARLGFYYSNKRIKSEGLVSGIYSQTNFLNQGTEIIKSDYTYLEIPLTFHYMLNKPYDKNKEGTCYTSYTQYNRKKPLFYLFFGPAYSVNNTKHEFVSRSYTTAMDTALQSFDALYVDAHSINHLGIYAGIGVMKYFNKKLYLSAEPVLRFFPVRWYSKSFKNPEDAYENVLSPRASNFHVRDMPWSVGLQISLNYHF